MMKVLKIVLGVMTSLATVFLSANELESFHTDYSYCLVCHGAVGNGNQAIQAPALVGIETWYLNQQLMHYQEHHRGADIISDVAGAEMLAVAREITPSSFTAIAEFIETLPTTPAVSTVNGNPEAGKVLYSATCAACHGMQAEGNEALLAPNLARLNDWYIVSAFEKYRSGLRGKAIEPLSAYQMHVMTLALPETFSIHDVASYIQTLTVNSQGETP